jgi:hypothetical protein
MDLANRLIVVLDVLEYVRGDHHVEIAIPERYRADVEARHRHIRAVQVACEVALEHRCEMLAQTALWCDMEDPPGRAALDAGA